MKIKKLLVKVPTSASMSWPQTCALCLGTAAEEDTTTIPGEKIPYCSLCYARVRRLCNWKDSLFAIALIIGVIFGVLSLIGLVAQEDWLVLFRVQTYITAMAGGLLFMGAAYGLMWVAMLPLRLIFHSLLSVPGVREAKSKEPDVRQLRFVQAEYAERFQEDNAGAVLS